MTSRCTPSAFFCHAALFKSFLYCLSCMPYCINLAWPTGIRMQRCVLRTYAGPGFLHTCVGTCPTICLYTVWPCLHGHVWRTYMYGGHSVSLSSNLCLDMGAGTCLKQACVLACVRDVCFGTRFEMCVRSNLLPNTMMSNSSLPVHMHVCVCARVRACVRACVRTEVALDSLQ